MFTRLFICMLSICIAAASSAQVAFTDHSKRPSSEKNVFQKKSEKQRSASVVLFVGGAVLGNAGLAIISKDIARDLSADLVKIISLTSVNTKKFRHKASGPVLVVAGACAMLGSLQLFSASSKNKKKATLQVKDESLYLNQAIKSQPRFTAVGVKIHL